MTSAWLSSDPIKWFQEPFQEITFFKNDISFESHTSLQGAFLPESFDRLPLKLNDNPVKWFVQLRKIKIAYVLGRESRLRDLANNT